MEERLQKYMARCGVDSRRKCEDLIAQGLVEVNGSTVREPGLKIDPGRDRVKVDGKVLRVEKPAYYLHYKVKGVTTTVSDDLGRRTVMDCLPGLDERVYPVGRLDRESEGLLVLTNDGALANYLTHPAFGVEKTYRVVAEGRVPEEALRELAEKGMRLGPVLVKPSRVELVRYDNENTVALISVAEGINREVRRIFAALGHEVKKLLRIQVGPLGLAGMKRGGTRPLNPRELAMLKKGMAGAAAEGATPDELFPPGSAASRRPSGPRGRPRREKAPRRGKPDPAAPPPGGDRKRREKNPAARPGKGGGRTLAGRPERETASAPARTTRHAADRSAIRPADRADKKHRTKAQPGFQPRRGGPAAAAPSSGGRKRWEEMPPARPGKGGGKAPTRSLGREPGPAAAKKGWDKKARPVARPVDGAPKKYLAKPQADFRPREGRKAGFSKNGGTAFERSERPRPMKDLGPKEGLPGDHKARGAKPAAPRRAAMIRHPLSRPAAPAARPARKPAAGKGKGGRRG